MRYFSPSTGKAILISFLYILIVQIANASDQVAGPAGADLDGDGITDKFWLETSKEAAGLAILLEKPKKKRVSHNLQFKIGKNTQDSFCDGKISMKTESPILPVSEWCAPKNNSKGCMKLRKTNAQIKKLSMKGMKGLRLDAGECDAFHVYWDPIEKKFVWWRR